MTHINIHYILKGTSTRVKKIWLKKIQTELFAEIYSKSRYW